jgi:hypothetical protein
VNYFSIPKPNIKIIYKIINELKPSNVYNLAQKNLNKNYANNKIINQNSKINNNIVFIEHNSIKAPINNNNALIMINNKKNKKRELYGQDLGLKNMKTSPPKGPELFLHIYNLKNRDILFKNNETVGILNKGNIPNVYFNHLMIDEKYVIFNNKCKYNRISLTQRNKNKLLTIIYYSH